MCAERRLTSGELDELILKCLADGMGLHRIMQELYGACGVWLAVFDTSSGTIFCVPDGDAGRMDVLERLKRVIVDGFLAGDAKTVALLRDGKPVVFGPDEECGRLHVCGVASPHTEPRSIISAGISDESWLELGHELLSRLCRLYEFFNRRSAREQPVRDSNYLESGLARELILGVGDISKSLFGDLYELRFNGLSTGIEPDYVVAAMSPAAPADERTLAELGRALVKLVPQSFRLVTGGRLYIFAYGIGSRRMCSFHDKLRYFCELNSLVCGVSDSFGSLKQRGGYRRQAEQVLKLSLDEGRRGVTLVDDVYFEMILSGAVESVGKKVLELSEVTLLADYDEKNNTDYLATLEAYLSFGNRLSAAASSMFIDRSTMKYRLQKISDLLCADFDDPDTAKRLSLGIAIHKLKAQG